MNLIEQAKGNTKRLWQTIDKVTGRKSCKDHKLEININGNLETDAQIVANHFNNYFIESVKELGIQNRDSNNYVRASDCIDLCTKSDCISYEQNMLHFKLANELEIKKCMQSLTNSKSKDIWGCSS